MSAQSNNSSIEHSRHNANPDIPDSELVLDESDSKDIDSCINFLSILDDDSSDDSSGYTLFKKKAEPFIKKDDSSVFQLENTLDKAVAVEQSTGRGFCLEKDFKANLIQSDSNNLIQSENTSVINSEKLELNVALDPLQGSDSETLICNPSINEHLQTESLKLTNIYQDICSHFTGNSRKTELQLQTKVFLDNTTIKMDQQSKASSPATIKLITSNPVSNVSISEITSPYPSLQLKTKKKSNSVGILPKIVIKSSVAQSPCKDKLYEEISELKHSPSFKVRGTKSGQNIFKICGFSNVKGAQIPILQSANNVVLKVSKFPKIFNKISQESNSKLHVKVSKFKKSYLERIESISTKHTNSSRNTNLTKGEISKIDCENKTNNIMQQNDSAEILKEEINVNEEPFMIYKTISIEVNPSEVSKGGSVREEGSDEAKISNENLVCLPLQENEKNDLLSPERNNLSFSIDNSNNLFSKPLIQEVTPSLDSLQTSSLDPFLKYNAKAKTPMAKKKIKFRLREGSKKQNKRARKKKEVILTKPLKSKKSGKIQRKQGAERSQKNKYLPLIRTELPTFLNKIDCNNPKKSLISEDESLLPIENKEKMSENEKFMSQEKLNNCDSVLTLSENDKSIKNQLKKDTDNNSLDSDLFPLASNILSDNDSATEQLNFKHCYVNPLVSVPNEISTNNNLLMSRNAECFNSQSIEDENLFVQEERGTDPADYDMINNQNCHQNSKAVKVNEMCQNNCLQMEEGTLSLKQASYINDINTHVAEHSYNLAAQSNVDNSSLPHRLIELQSIDANKSVDNRSKPSEDDFPSDLPKSNPLMYSYNELSPLSFSVQNILENTFKYESFPSSSNMARLAKLMEVHWKDVRDWFVARRNLNKRNGIFPRNQVLTECPVCPEFKAAPNEPSLVHLLSKDHIHNMMTLIIKDEIRFRCRKDTEQKSSAELLSSASCDFINMTGNDRLPENMTNKAEKKQSYFTPDLLKGHIIRPDRENTSPLSLSSEKNYSKRISVTNQEKALKFARPSHKFGMMVVDSSKHQQKRYALAPFDQRIFIGYRCPDCSKIFHSEWMLIRHTLSHRRLICSDCNQVFYQQDILQRHFKEHIIQSMERELCPMFICFKCVSLNCTCPQETRYIPSTNNNHYLRPQMAKRSKPFIGPPYLGVNDHLRVTLKEFLQGVGNPLENHLDRGVKSLKVKPDLQKNHKRKEPYEKPAVPTYTNLTTFNCDICESFFFTEDELKEHEIVHRIQARNRSKKKETTLSFETSVEKEKVSEEENSFYSCSYCHKEFKRTATLAKHLRRECKFLPKNISALISNGNLFNVVKAEKGNGYRVKITDTSKPAPKAKVKRKPLSDTCAEKSFTCNSSLEKNHASNYKALSDDGNTKSILKSIRSESQDFFICCYCSIPLESKVLVWNHLKKSCSVVPSEVKLELFSHSLQYLERFGSDAHFKKVKKSQVYTFLTPNKLCSILDPSTCHFYKQNQRRVICKFCCLSYLRSSLRRHLFKQCKSIPADVRSLMLKYKGFLFKKLSNLNSSTFDSTKSFHTVDNGEQTESRSETLPIESITRDMKGDSSASKELMLYDCHLCEEKIKLRSDFIAHMSEFHCMNVAPESAYKWIVSVDEDRVGDGEILSPQKYPFSSRRGSESLFEQDSELDSIAETLHVNHDYTVTQEQHPSLVSQPRSPLGKNDLHSLSDFCDSSRKNYDDEFIGDLEENLDNFIENVQLEDRNFNNTLL